MHLTELMAQLEARHGKEPFVADENGCYALETEGVALTVIPVKDGARALLFSRVCAAPETGLEELAQLLLQANHRLKSSYAATFSLDDENATICLQKTLECERDGLDGLLAVAESLVNLTHKWKPLIEQYVPNAVANNANEAECKTPATQEKSPSNETLNAIDLPNYWLAV